MQRLVDDHYEALYRFAFRLSGSAADAADLTQETYCKAQQSLGQLRDENRAKPWLFRILRNLFLQRVRSPREEWVSLETTEETASPTDEEPVVDSEELQRALGELPEVYRTPVILYYFDDFSYRAIADQMDLPIGTVMSRLARAKSFLRARLQGEHHGKARIKGRAENGL